MMSFILLVKSDDDDVTAVVDDDVIRLVAIAVIIQHTAALKMTCGFVKVNILFFLFV